MPQNISKPFLQQTAGYLYSTYGDDLQDCCMVFPGRRAGLFFSDYLSNLAEKPMWSPSIMSINDFFIYLSGLEVADPVLLIYELYQTYKQYVKTPEPFEDFYYWGEMLLKDFEDIDKYMANARALFQNLSALKSLTGKYDYLTDAQKEAIKSFWDSFDPDNPSRSQQAFLALWEQLQTVYEQYREKLRKQSLAYEGMVYREVAEKLEKGEEIPSLKWKKVAFIGFNALTVCEEVLFNRLKNDNTGLFFWDTDRYYVDNNTNEAGFFIRQNIKKYPAPPGHEVSDNFCADDKHIECFASSTDIGQAKIAGQLLKNFHGNEEPGYNKTAMVLADESLLMPLLYAIPENIHQFNVTMGYPLYKTPVYSLAINLVDLQRNSKIINDSRGFYHRDVLNLLRHQFLTALVGEESIKVFNALARRNMIYIDQAELHKNAVLQRIFTAIDTPGEVFDYVLDVLYYISGRMATDDEEKLTADAINREYIYHLYKAVKRLKDIFIKEQMEITFTSFSRLLERIMRTIRIPFTGEPLAGIQVMGILETRTLDFENVILLSANEGILPATGQNASFIPYNLRRGFKLPVIEHNDAIYAYYFYRLLQRAKHVYIIYNTKTDGLKTGEVSRFVSQLKYEAAQPLKENVLIHNIHFSSSKPIVVKKDADVMKLLYKYTDEENSTAAFSPSALNKYISCSLKFYFSYIAGIDEQEEISEEMDPASFGNIFHDVASKIYHDMLNKEVGAKEIETLLRDKEIISRLIRESFIEIFFRKENKHAVSGRNLIIEEIIKKYIMRLLNNDMNFTPFYLLGLEKKITMPVQVNTPEGAKNVLLRGMIDRVDSKHDTVRIIDYKTGQVKNTFNGIPSLFLMNDSNHRDEVFQTLFYCMLYSTIDDTSALKPLLYPVKSKNADVAEIKEGNAVVNDYRLYADDFKTGLKELLSALFDPGIDFTQTDDIETCKNCPYQKICHRQDA